MEETIERSRTVRDELEALGAWRERIEQGRIQYGERWAERAFAVVARRDAKLREFDPDMALIDFATAMTSDLLSDEEKWVLRWQHHHHGQFYSPGSFERAFFQLIEEADEHNLELLARSWPMEVRAINEWRSGGMAERLRALPLAFDI